MNRALESAAIVALLSMSLTSATRARDHGVVGQAFPIIEPDLMATMEAKLQRLQASGGIDRMNTEFARRAEARVRRPKPVAGISAATEARTWAYDPTIIIERDVQDQKGNYIARAGQSVNPLDFTAVRQALVFVNGDSKAEMDWATSQYSDLKGKIILVNGSPIEEMTARQRRFYFDQEGRLTGKLGVRHTPAVAVQDGRVMKLTEIKLKGNS
ncbi:type-F conjugative transfer system protein TraW [Sphingomonas sanguinis]|uniref:Type-F conjugative transfer system protein TraW n=1 Tax=Sphingomonas sanguinis TaxID=33051 RepID=A0A7Y7QX70_9SPHN|nr:type-F conjugative transfer system protein TraW [Sphingomonas sanguinis]NNG48217.1 type-F conjugative transfer system protein TraW [Sphingomonas sanguinis]NNG54963.1 type-F conjugative transfer system protein TraW [Sphingomonas sanguinis]NVP32352.1 type-F conjugative transfer system protein TraW [Sphingomonas sanguinis]